MSDEDLASVISYIRSLPSVQHPLSKTEIPFPVSRLINSVPEPIDGGVREPDLSTPEKRGAYLTTLGSCRDCHTPRDDKGQYLPGMELAGGNILQFKDARPARAASNLTPSPNGIPYYNEDLFVETIRTGRVRDRQLSDVMPWGHYRGMTDEDLKAIFAFLKTVTPVDHYVDNALPPTLCARCNIRHGGGERNSERRTQN